MPRFRAPAAVRVLIVAGAAALFAGTPAGAAPPDDADAPLESPPAYVAPPGIDSLPESRAAAARECASRVELPRSAQEHDAAVRRLTAIGPGALPEIARALRGASWRARAGLVEAAGEMDAPQATPLLVLASRDPSFAVRAAAVTGLGKTGDASGARAVIARASAGSEPAWRVRVAAATAIRRSLLRGTMAPEDGAPALVDLLDDADGDVRRAALDAVAPLALPGAVDRLLDLYAEARGPAEERETVLRALRAYRRPSAAIVAALRRGFLQGTDAAEAVRAARAILDVSGPAALEDPEFAAAVLHHLTDEASADAREAIVSLGTDARDWLAAKVRETALRDAGPRADPGESAFEPLVDALFQVDEDATLDALRWVLAGPQAESLHVETRRAALRKAGYGFAARMGPELRAFLASPAGRDMVRDALAAVAASGGDDVAALVDAALRDAEASVRFAALDVLDTFPGVPTPPSLAEIVRGAESPRERARALSCLGRRDAAAAAEAAAGLLSHPDPSLRDAAVTEIGSARDPAYADRLRARLREEDGKSSEAAATGSEEPAVPSAVTGNDVARSELRRRGALRSAIVRALRAVAGPAARADLRAAAIGDRDEKVREAAVQELHLHDLATAEDAPDFVARLAEEPSDEVRQEIRRLLARLGDAPAAREMFAADVADPARRGAALRLLAEARSRVVPDALEAGLVDPSWNDEERSAALRTLVRAGRRPPVAALAELARRSRTLELVGDLCRALAADGSPEALDALAALLAEETDPSRRALAAQGIGESRSPRMVPLLVELLDAARPAALAAATRTSPDVQLYRDCALALGKIASDDAGRALVAHLLGPDLAALGAARSRPTNGPFQVQPDEGAIVCILRSLVAAAAHVDDGRLSGMVERELARGAPEGRGFEIDEEYADGVARYLTDPVAYDLPPRLRPAAALPLWRLVAEGPPRWSPLDGEAWERTAAELEMQNRHAEAADAMERSVALDDVEDAARAPDVRRWERGRILSLRARAALAAGSPDEARRLAADIRTPDPRDGDLADLHGWCLVKLGDAGAEAEASIRDAMARDHRNARAIFHLAWVVERREGPARAVPLYEEAARVDDRRVADMGRAQYLTHRRGLSHRWGHYYYWKARALATAGRSDGVGAALTSAILLDDRYAAQALTDPAFEDFEDRALLVEETLRRIPDDPYR